MPTTVSPPVPPSLIDTAESARLSGCSVRHWRRLVAAGRAPQPVRLGGLVRWRRTELLAWIADGCPAPGRQERGEARYGK
jgi:predicted DNA-binding transcriptional regulator AlpA